MVARGARLPIRETRRARCSGASVMRSQAPPSPISGASSGHRQPSLEKRPPQARPCPPGPSEWWVSCRRYIDRVEKELRSEVEALLGPNAANRFFDCRRFLVYRWNRETQKQSLIRVHACGYPFCPMCGWERKQDLGRRAEIGTKRLQKAQPLLRWLDLLFTVRNCELDDLRRTAEAMNQGFRSITRSANWRDISTWRRGCIPSS